MAMTGGCLCGAVRYEANAAPLFGGNCYCTDCRKTTSSHSAVVALPEAGVTFTGETRGYTKMGDSGKPVTRVFCPICGTALFSRGENNAGVIMLKAGTLDDVESFKPMASIYASRAPSWDRPPADVPAFPEMPPRG